MGRRVLVVAAMLLTALPARAHDIPNARVDRSIQATVRPGLLRVDYEVSLSELTLTRDLRELDASFRAADRGEWFRRYGEVSGPLNARGLLVSVEGRPVGVSSSGFDLAVEEHPRYTFHFSAPLPPRGRLRIQDTNFAASEGTSRLAIRARGGAKVSGDELPEDVEQIAFRPLWELSDAEERRTKEVAVNFSTVVPLSATPEPSAPKIRPAPGPGAGRLSELLDRRAGRSFWGLALLALGLGAIHALQPGHGKTLVAASASGEGGSTARGVVLAAIVTFTHAGSVLLVAAGLWVTRSTRYELIQANLSHLAGFLIAVIGVWRLGRHLGGWGTHEAHEGLDATAGRAGLVGAGVAGGLVPCWDAVGLVVLAEAVGRLGLGIALLLAFGLGMGGVLVAIGGLAGQLRVRVGRSDPDGWWERSLGLAGGLALSAIGVYLLSR